MIFIKRSCMIRILPATTENVKHISCIYAHTNAYVQGVCVCICIYRICVLHSLLLLVRFWSYKGNASPYLPLCLVLYSLRNFPMHLIQLYPRQVRVEGQGSHIHVTKEMARVQGGKGHPPRPHWHWVPGQDSDLGVLRPDSALLLWLCDNFLIMGRVKMISIASEWVDTTEDPSALHSVRILGSASNPSRVFRKWIQFKTKVMSKDRTSESKAFHWKIRLTSHEVTKTIGRVHKVPWALFCSSSSWLVVAVIFSLSKNGVPRQNVTETEAQHG